MALATGPAHFFLPLEGIEEWDGEGQEAYDPEGLAALIDEARKIIPDVLPMAEIDAHINDRAFSDAVMVVFETG